MHIFLTGPVQVGKSTIIRKTLDALQITPAGFRSVSVPDLADGQMSVYIIPAGAAAPAMGDFNRVGIRKGAGRGIEKIPEAFERAGVQTLQGAEHARLILMDEVGRMESQAQHFSERILELLDGPVPILGVVQKIADTPLTNAIRKHPNVQIVEVSVENREEKAREVLTLVSKELDRTTDSGGAIVFREDDVLMIRVGRRWSFPKGHMESGETAAQAAKRETLEETGVLAELLEHSPLPVPSALDTDRRTVWFFPARYIGGALTPQPEEISEAAWVNISDAASKITFEPDREVFLRALEIMQK